MEDEACYDLRKARDAKYRTHLFYLAYDSGKVDDYDITWVAQLSLDRLQMIEPLCRLWEGNLNTTLTFSLTIPFNLFVIPLGPISLALYLSDAEAEQFQHFVFESEYLNSRTNIGYHVVYEQGVRKLFH